MQVTTSVDDFPALMRDWAEWTQNLQGLGYSGSTTIWRAQFGSGGGEFESTVPLGIRLLETPGALRRLIDAMDARMAAESAAYDAAIAAYPWPTIPAALGTPPSGGTQNGLSYPITSYPLTVYRPYAIN